MEMMRRLHHVKMDHLCVGWYKSTYYSSFITKALLDSQFSYQDTLFPHIPQYSPIKKKKSAVLIYNPIKTAQGSLSLTAYRLTPKLMEVCKKKYFSPEALKKGNITFEHKFEEGLIVIKNSHVISVLMWALKKSAVADKRELLSLASSTHLGKNLQLQIDRVDEMSQDVVQYNTNMRSTLKQQPQKHQYQQHRGSVFKPPQPPARIDSLHIAGQINTYYQNIKVFHAPNLGKLFMAQALQEYNN
uniref:eIF3h C-terminal domain-containing protein n=1 Tax=Rhinolophus ferrumequinum TaxID=59479 RepID=A0A671E936_RHIFE